MDINRKYDLQTDSPRFEAFRSQNRLANAKCINLIWFPGHGKTKIANLTLKKIRAVAMRFIEPNVRLQQA